MNEWSKKTLEITDSADYLDRLYEIYPVEPQEREMKDFCNTELNASLAKRPDLVAKSGNKYVIGEAKFLSSLGGNQGRGFDDAFSVASNPTPDAYTVALVDGVIWAEKGSRQYRLIETSNVYIFSALLLKDFLDSIS